MLNLAKSKEGFSPIKINVTGIIKIGREKDKCFIYSGKVEIILLVTLRTILTPEITFIRQDEGKIFKFQL
jgi:hypothetical protein